ncbi:TDT family transporter [Streptomyces sp. NA02950]|uniref:TDT family transporter n=1 Tax=Streptomyces sp. NA02950 TaxID=2742137 RepID=UPI001590D90A|nr:TDT family transporter [Streptomyces sp. NA02950]QKV95923.1 TDT family transporter [Streptomyces sp. NA02950]
MVTLAPARPLPAAVAEPPRASVRHLGPNWYATVMGTAIVAGAGAGLPVGVPWLRDVCRPVWALSVLMLAAVLVARTVHWARHRDRARAHLLDPAVAPFYGCLAMALLAVGGGTLTVGSDVIGVTASVALDAVLWTAGTLLGLVVAAGIPCLMVTRHRIGPADASPVWLLPVVAPMVSAALGPPLVPHLPAGQWREAMLVVSGALMGASLLATLLMLPLVFARLLCHGPLPAAQTPALFLVLGPLGQSTTAAGALADALRSAGYSGAPEVAARFASVAYGVPVMGFALLWLALAGALVVRAVRRGMPFAMTWWGFTFPVGTCVTGAAALSRHTGLHAFGWLSVGLYGFLVAAWAVVWTRTAVGVARGTLLAPPPPSLPPSGPQDADARAALSTAGASANEGPYQVR